MHVLYETKNNKSQSWCNSKSGFHQVRENGFSLRTATVCKRPSLYLAHSTKIGGTNTR